MLLNDEEYISTQTSKFKNVTESAENFNSQEFDLYISNNLVDDLGIMHIDLIYETDDEKYRHVIFNTEIKNVHYVAIIDLKSKIIKGHYILDLNKEYGIKS